MFVLTGVPGPEPQAPLDVSALVRRLVIGNQVLLGAVNAGRGAFESAADNLAAFHRCWPREPAALVTGRHPIEEAEGLLAERRADIKDVIRVAGGP